MLKKLLLILTYIPGIISLFIIIFVLVIMFKSTEHPYKKTNGIQYISGDTLSINGERYVMKKATNIFYLEKVR